MTKRLIRFLNLVMVALVTGSIFGIWLGYNPKRLIRSNIHLSNNKVQSPT